MDNTFDTDFNFRERGNNALRCMCLILYLSVPGIHSFRNMSSTMVCEVKDCLLGSQWQCYPYGKNGRWENMHLSFLSIPWFWTERTACSSYIIISFTFTDWNRSKNIIGFIHQRPFSNLVILASAYQWTKTFCFFSDNWICGNNVHGNLMMLSMAL